MKKLLFFAAIFSSFFHGKEIFAQNRERWYQIPEKKQGFFSHEPMEKSAAGEYSLKVVIEGFPKTIHRFSKDLYEDLESNASGSIDTSSTIESIISKMSRFKDELFQEAVIGRDLTATAAMRVASTPDEPHDGTSATNGAIISPAVGSETASFTKSLAISGNASTPVSIIDTASSATSTAVASETIPGTITHR